MKIKIVALMLLMVLMIEGCGGGGDKDPEDSITFISDSEIYFPESDRETFTFQVKAESKLNSILKFQLKGDKDGKFFALDNSILSFDKYYLNHGEKKSRYEIDIVAFVVDGVNIVNNNITNLHKKSSKVSKKQSITIIFGEKPTSTPTPVVPVVVATPTPIPTPTPTSTPVVPVVVAIPTPTPTSTPVVPVVVATPIPTPTPTSTLVVPVVVAIPTPTPTPTSTPVVPVVVVTPTPTSTSTPTPTEEAIVHNGSKYSTVVSPYTDRVWLDRNLGASRVCTSVNDVLCYGDYYQWGRGFDGHEKYNSEVTNIQADNLNNVGNKFIESNEENNGDWAKDIDIDGNIRSAFWNKTDGTGVCPVGFRVANIDEILLETFYQDVKNRFDAFNNFLKLPSAGERGYYLNSNHIMSNREKSSWGCLWARDSSLYYNEYSSHPYFNDDIFQWSSSQRANGCSVRCIKD